MKLSTSIFVRKFNLVMRWSIQDALLQDFSITASTRFFLLGIGFVTGVISARALGPTGRGELTAVMIWGTFIATFGALGLTQSLAYYVSKLHDREEEQTSRLIWTYWLMVIPLSIVSVTIGYLAVPFLLRAQSDAVVRNARLFLLWVPIGMIGGVHFALQGRSRFMSWNLFRLLKPVLYLVVLVILWLFGRVTVPSITKTLIIISIFELPLLVLLLRKEKIISQARITVEAIPEMLRFGIKSVLGSVPALMNNRIDQLMMAAWIVPSQLGLYVVAVAWSGLLGPLVTAIGETTFPLIAGASTSEMATQRFERMMRNAVVILLLLSAAMLMVTPLMLPLVFGAHYKPSIATAMVLVVAGMIWQLNSLIQTGLSGLGFPSASAWSQGSSLIFTVLFLYLLLPKYQIIGASLASLGGYTISVAVLLWFTRQMTSVSIRAMFVPSKQDFRYIIHKVIPAADCRNAMDDG